MKKIILLFIAAFALQFSFGQDFSNKGKDFWVGYGNHIRMLQPNNGAEQMQIYLTSDVNTTGTVTFSSGTAAIPFTVTANQITVIDVPQRTTNYLPDEGLYTRGIHISALKPIVAYGFIYVNAISGATVFLPTNTLGKEYYAVNYKQQSNEPAQSYSYFFVEAVEPGTTTVEITPTQNTKGGWAANVTQTVNLTQGQIYQVLSQTDLTGSKVKSIASGSSSCKRIAFFCGSGKISIGCNSPGSSDNLYQQMYPASTWGKKYILIPSNNVPGNINTPINTLPTINTNFFRVYRPDATTVVTQNGVIIPPASFVNNSFDFSSNQTNVIDADKSILVAQYFTTASCSGNSNPHDPEMIYLNPVEQTIDDVTVNSMQPATNTAIYQHHINVVLKNTGTSLSSFQIDGINPPTSAFTVLPQDNSFSYIRIRKQGGSDVTSSPNLTSGAHRLTCDSGFNAIAYGFGLAESYGYSAGANLRDLFTTYGTFNVNASPTETSSSVCTGSPFKFKMSLPFQPTSLTWKFSLAGIPGLTTDATLLPDPGCNPPPPTLPFTPTSFPTTGLICHDSVTVVDGKPKFWYSLPTNYTINLQGQYSIPIIATSANNDGCGTTRDYDFPLGVYDPPIAGFKFNAPGCNADPVQFTDTTITIKPNYKWFWNFDDVASGASNTSNLQNPVHLFSSVGLHTVTLTTITTVGCSSSTSSQIVTVPNLVDATVSGSNVVCQNSTAQQNVVFTGTGGVLPYTFTYTETINGFTGSAQTIQSVTSPSNLATATINVPTSTVGTYTFNLIKVENANPAYCSRVISNQSATITINPLPSATISGTSTVCQNTTPQPVVTFTGSNATAPYKFTYTLNGVTQPVATSNAAGVYTITVPTNAPLNNVYQLVSVQESSNPTACSQPITGQTATVIVQQNPTATITTTSTAVCQNGTAPTVTFTASGGVAPYNFTYTLNGVTQPVVTSNASGVYTITVPLTTSGALVYTLNSVENLTPISCVTPLNSSVTVLINTVPTATIAGSTAVCQVAGSQTITFTGANGTPPYKFFYNINGGPTLNVTSVGNTATVTAPVTTVGNYIYNLLSVQELGTTTQCSQTQTGTATVVVQATSTATVSGTTTLCQDTAAPNITFTAANGVAPFKFVYTVTTNGVVGPQQIATSAAGSFIAPVPVPMTTVGTLIYTLVSVQNTGGQTCITPITGQTATVVINPVPTATIAGTTTVCQNSTQPQVTFNGFGAIGNSYMFNYTINGVAQAALTGNNLTVNQPTGTANVYTYIITSVKDNATGCIRNYSGATAPTAVVTVKQLATATVATNAATVCQNSTAPTITFTATGGQAPYKFTYTITFNGVVGLPITTLYTPFGNSITVTAPTTTAGTYLYTLVNVEESANACVNAQTGSTQVIVHPQPTASYTTTPPYCAQNAVTITPSFGITPTGSVVSWVWDYGDGTGPHIRPNGNPFTLTYPTAGVKVVTFKTISDKGCESVLYSTNVTINSKPKAGFKSPEACLADTYAQFTDTSKVLNGTIVYWEWDFGDGSPIYAGNTTGPISHQNPSHAYLAVGQKTVRLIVTSNSGCKDTIIQSFFINGEVLSANFIPLNNPNFCSNRPVQIKENSIVVVGGLIRVDIYWDNATSPTVFELDDFPTPNKIYSHSYPNLQVDRNYQIRYIAYSGFNGLCQKEVTRTITVRASPIAVFAPIQNVCLNGGPIVLNTGTPSGGTGAYLGNGVTVNNGVYTFNPLAAGVTVGNNNNITYTVTSVASCDSSLVQPIKVLAPPVINSFTITSNKCINNAITFHNTYTNGDGTVVKWIYDWGDNTAIQTFTTGADQTHTYTTTGVKTATLTLETGFGCRNLAFPITFTVNPLPVPNYTPTTSVCLPNAVVTFTNTTASIASNTYAWSFEYPSTTAANTSTQTNGPTHLYNSQGPFNTHLVATNIATGCKDSSAIIVINSNTIHPAPVLSFNNIPDVCLNNGTVQINQASETSGIAGGPGIYSCLDAPSAITTTGVFNPLTAGEGLHTIKYTWTSTFNCTTTITKTVRVLIAPVVNTFTTVGNRCEQNQIVFSNTSTALAGTVVKWVYTWGDGTNADTVLNGNNFTHTYATSNITIGYTATLMLITSDGCKSLPKPLQVFVNPIPIPDFTYTDTTCLPQAKVIFKNTTPNITDWAYQWNLDFPSTIPADQSSLVTNVPYTYTTLAPQHSVKLVATSGLTGCTNSIIKPVVSIHPAPVASFYFDKASICVNQQVGVIDGPSDFKDGAPKTWVWDYGDNTIGNGQTQSQHTYTTAQTFNVKLTVTNSFGCVDDSTRPFVVYPYPVIDAGRDTVILQGGQTVLTASATGNDLSYLWTGNISPLNLSSTIVLNPTASPEEDIRYTLEVKARGGCKSTDTVHIKVLKYPEIPNTFTPNNDGIHDTWVIKYLDSYPDCFVQVFTRTGQLVFESKGYKKPWDGNKGVKSLPFDTYYYIVEPGSGRRPLTGYVTIVK